MDIYLSEDDSECVNPYTIHCSGRSRKVANIGEEALEACRRLLGVEPIGLDYPGGRSRKSVRVQLPGRNVIVSRRRHLARADLEMNVLKALRAENAPVPEVLASEDRWLIQEDLGGRRLSEVLARSSPEDTHLWIERAIDSISMLHRAGRAAGLHRLVASLGTTNEWLHGFAEAPQRLGEWLQVPPPALNVEGIANLLRPRQLTLIKWDARPGNAVAQEEHDAVAWFDWEHCGCRHPLDDIVWLLGDDHMPGGQHEDLAFIERQTRRFAFGQTPEEATSYFGCFGSLHICMRLGLILWNKGDGDWWDEAYCLDFDKVAVTQQAALRLCGRGARWSELSAETEPLAVWFREISERITTL